ncbi:MAG: hypothetical protein ABL940_13335 [Bacteroidia bacterium]
MLIVVTNSIVNYNANFKISTSINKIIIGDSHPECAYNDSLISNFGNYAASGESYFYSYFKLKKIIEQNKNIDTVFLEFSNNLLGVTIDNRIWDNEPMISRYDKYGAFIDIDANVLIASYNPIGYFDELSFLLKNNLNCIATNNYIFWNNMGGYLYLNRNKTDSLVDNLPAVDVNVYKVPPHTIKYLKNTIDLCTKNGIKVFLIRSPMHQKYEMRNNEKLFQRTLLENFPNVEFLDLKDYPAPNNEFGDLHHLNYKGAKRYSTFFNCLIKKGLLISKNKLLFIDNEILTKK